MYSNTVQLGKFEWTFRRLVLNLNDFRLTYEAKLYLNKVFIDFSLKSIKLSLILNWLVFLRMAELAIT